MPSDDRSPAGSLLSKRDTFLLASVAMTFIATLAVLLSSVTLDDAYITFRYARHLAEGYGLGAWNHTGERVEGYSSPLWTVLLAGAAWLGADLRIASKVFGAAAALTLMAVLFRRRHDRPAVLAGVFFALYLPFVFYAASGMESVAFTCLVTLALVGPAEWQPMVAPLLVAMRPEGALVAGIDVVALAWRRERWRWVAATALAAGLTLTAIEVHRWMAYGALAPNTYYAKVAGGGFGHVRLGFSYVGGWILAHVAVAAFVGIGIVAVARAGDRRGLTCFVLFAAYTLYMVSAGGDAPSAFPFWRQFIHVAPAWVLLAMTGLVSVVRHRRWRQVSAAVGLALAADLGILLMLGGGGPRPGIAGYNAWLASLATPTTTISSSYGGALPFVVDAVHIDAFGLNTPYIARHGTFDPDGPQDSKTDMGWVMEQRPDIVEGYLSGLALLRDASRDEILGMRRRKMILEMVSSPRFQREYVFVRNAPYGLLDRAVFLRRDFWEAHPQRDTLDCVPVAETALAAFANRDTLNPPQQANATVQIYAPDQHDLYDGQFVISANRIYMIGTLHDPVGWDHLDNEARTVRPVAGTAEIDVNEIQNSGTFKARLTIPEGDLVLALDEWREFSPCQNGGIVAYIHEHGTSSGCGDSNWPKTLAFVAGWGIGHAILNGQPLYQAYEIHFMVTQGLRDRKTLRVNYPMADKKHPGGETNPATQQIDFYIRSPQQNPRNRPAREVFLHFFGMEITWK